MSVSTLEHLLSDARTELVGTTDSDVTIQDVDLLRAEDGDGREFWRVTIFLSAPHSHSGWDADVTSRLKRQARTVVDSLVAETSPGIYSIVELSTRDARPEDVAEDDHPIEGESPFDVDPE